MFEYIFVCSGLTTLPLFFTHTFTHSFSLSTQQVLWAIARDCLDQAAVQWNPLSLLLKVRPRHPA